MNSTVETQNSLDTVKLVVAVLAVIAAVAGFLYPGLPLLFRVGGLLIGGGVAVAIALQTSKGREVWAFFREAQIEVRKVVWPTRQETVQTTLVVILVVILVAIILWLLDIFLGWSISSLMA